MGLEPLVLYVPFFPLHQPSTTFCFHSLPYLFRCTLHLCPFGNFAFHHRLVDQWWCVEQLWTHTELWWPIQLSSVCVSDWVSESNSGQVTLSVCVGHLSHYSVHWLLLYTVYYSHYCLLHIDTDIAQSSDNHCRERERSSLCVFDLYWRCTYHTNSTVALCLWNISCLVLSQFVMAYTQMIDFRFEGREREQIEGNT